MRLPKLIFIFCFLALQNGLSAQPLIGIPEDICNYSLSAAESRLVQATAFLVPADKVLYDNVSDTYTVTQAPLHSWGATVCSSSDFYGEPSVGNGRTAVLIGSNQMITAQHDGAFDPTLFKVIFRPAVQIGCSNFIWSNIHPDNVYSPQAVEFSGLSYFPAGVKYDYMTFRLSKDVKGRRPVKIRRSGAPTVGDPIFMAGFPFWSSMRVEGGGDYTGMAEAGYGPSYRYLNLHPFAGSSGSAIYNVADEVIDVVVAGSLNGNIGDFTQPSGPCVDFIHQDYPSAPFGMSTNYPVVDVSSQIPRAEVLVTPIDEVLHVGDLGGILSNAVTNYELRKGEKSNQYAVDPAVGFGMPGSPTLTSNIAPGDLLLDLLNPTTLTLTASASAVTACGTWNYTVNVRDRQHLQNNYLRHRFEVGLQEISMSPDDGWEIGDLGLPFDKTKTYTLKNVRPTAADLRIRTTEAGYASPWLLVNGVHSLDVTLAAEGAPGDELLIELTVDAAAAARTEFQSFPAVLSVDFLDDDCAVVSSIIRDTSFSLGIQESVEWNDGNVIMYPLPSGVSYGTPLAYQFDMSSNVGFCVGDIDVELGVNYLEGTLAGIEDAAEILQVRLRSPLGTDVLLWDQDTIPNASYVGSEPGDMFPVQTLILDETSSPPVAGSLGAFNGEEIDGQWELEVRRGVGLATIYPSHARLKFTKGACLP